MNIFKIANELKEMYIYINIFKIYVLYFTQRHKYLSIYLSIFFIFRGLEFGYE